MIKKSQIKFKDFIRGIGIIVKKKCYECKFIEKRGSGIRIEFFENNEKIPFAINVFHKDRYVHRGDLEKACKTLKIKIDDFIKTIEKK